MINSLLKAIASQKIISTIIDYLFSLQQLKYSLKLIYDKNQEKQSFVPRATDLKEIAVPS